jgi:hypothetical protein
LFKESWLTAEFIQTGLPQRRTGAVTMRPLLLPPALAGQTWAMPATCGANGHPRLKAMLSGLLQQRSWWSPEFMKVYHRVPGNAVIAITKMRFRGGKTHPPEPPSSLLPRALVEA